MDDVIAADQGFFDALMAMFGGDAGPMKAVWSHEADCVYMGPNQRILVGWSNIAPDWDVQAEMKMGGRITVAERHVIAAGDLATVYHRAVAENLDANGKTVTFETRGTNVLRREAGVWKLVAHHSDPVPFLEGT